MDEHVHSLKPQMSVQSSVMGINIILFGFECEGCEKKWDIGDLMQAILAAERLSREIREHDAITRTDKMTFKRWARELEGTDDID